MLWTLGNPIHQTSQCLKVQTLLTYRRCKCNPPPRMLPSNKSRSPSSSASSASFWIALASLVSRSHQFHSFQRYWFIPASRSSNALFELFQVFEVLPLFQLVNFPFKHPLAAQLCPPEAPRKTPKTSKTKPVRLGSKGSSGSLVAAREYIGANGDIYIYIYGSFLKWWYLQIIYFKRIFHYKQSLL